MSMTLFVALALLMSLCGAGCIGVAFLRRGLRPAQRRRLVYGGILLLGVAAFVLPGLLLAVISRQ